MNVSRVDALLSMIEEQANDPFLHYALATEYRNMGKEAETIAQYLKTLELDPEYMGVFLHMASFLANSGKITEAKAYYLRGIEIAIKKNDKHALRELQAAYNAFEEWAADE